MEDSNNTIRNGRTRLSTGVVEQMQIGNQSLSQAIQQGWKRLTQQLIGESLLGSEKAKAKSDGNRNDSGKAGNHSPNNKSEKHKAKLHGNRTNLGRACVRARPELTYPKINRRGDSRIGAHRPKIYPDFSSELTQVG